MGILARPGVFNQNRNPSVFNQNGNRHICEVLHPKSGYPKKSDCPQKQVIISKKSEQDARTTKIKYGHLRQPIIRYIR
ncbi:MAG: hypothetical protein KME64_42480 [Scytonematopsis contorta HA4267-MV1]|nr:hypothetical protein [Scytonematopsis contorta HA4267-MV1]